jgi:NifU-like protein involved in Fe-S cluster formation
MYSAQVLDHFEHPRNAGAVADADASDCARYSRYGSGALWKQPATLLQHVGTNPSGAFCLLKHP